MRRGRSDAAQIRSKAKTTVATATESAKAEVAEAGGSIAAPAAEWARSLDLHLFHTERAPSYPVPAPPG